MRQFAADRNHERVRVVEALLADVVREGGVALEDPGAAAFVLAVRVAAVPGRLVAVVAFLAALHGPVPAAGGDWRK